MNRKLIIVALGLTAVFAGCTSGNTGVPPTVNAVNPITTNVLEFAVGTATIAVVQNPPAGSPPGTPPTITSRLGLNTVVSYRQPNGLDGTLLNMPSITGPIGFVNNASTAGTDVGTNRISGSPQANPVGSPTIATTFGTAGGAFAYGFQPNNSTTAGSPSFVRYSLPFFPTNGVTASPGVTAVQYIGGPPAYPNVRDGTFPSGFTGYPMGFTSFNLAPVAGTYTLTLTVPTGFDKNSNPTSANVTAAANLTSLAALPLMLAPTLTPDGNGGGTVSATIPAGVTEAMIIVRDGTGGCYPGANGAPVYYTFKTTTTGTQTFTLPDSIGPTFAGQTSTPSICTSAQNTAVARLANSAAPPQPGDTYSIYAVGFDYDAFGAGPPGNRSQSPTIAGANGQADITTSVVGGGSG